MLKLRIITILNRTSLRVLLPMLLIWAVVQQCLAQEFGGNPPSVKWQQVNTPAARVIFPAGMDSLALHVATIIRQANNMVLPTMGNRQKQVSIVLQNQTTETNGYVGLAPFRSEFYLTPQQNSFELGSMPWADMLSLHEYRHVQQYNNLNVGLSKVLGMIFGEGGQAIGNALSVPDWFFEGDAVYNETLLSKQGRGRLPFFFKDYRALWGANKNYSWMKLRNGSYKDFIPSHYPLGYMLVAYGREQYGDNFWRDVVQDAAAFNGGIYPLQKSIKKYSGKDYETFRSEAFNLFRKQFNDKAPAEVDPDSHFIADEEFPVFVDDNTIIYLKSAYDRIPAFTIKTDGKEQKINARGMAIDSYFNYHNGKIVYSGYRPDARWGFRNYGEIRILDIKTGHEKAITCRTKYFSPAFSPDGKTIAAVQFSAEGKSELHILSSETGQLLSAAPNPDNLYYTYPKFYSNEHIIAAVRNPAGEMGITNIDTKTGEHKYLLPPGYNLIGFLTLQNDTVYFSATSGKNDVLYALSIIDKKLYRLGSEALQQTIGNYQPTVSTNKIAWVGFTAYGYQINEVNKSQLSWTEISTGKLDEKLSSFNVTSLNSNEAAGLVTSNTDTTFQISNYNKSRNLFNFHSLIPDISDPNYKFSLVGENVLNTFQSELYFNYNRNEGYKQLGFDVTYGALFPYISAGVDYIFDRTDFSLNWNEANIHGGLQIPLNFSRGKKITGLNIGSDLYFTRQFFQDNLSYLNENFTYLNNYISFTTRVQQARQNIYPRFGQSLMLIYKSAFNVKGKQLLASGTFYFPGLSANHSTIITAAHQQHGRYDVSLPNNFPFSRGYTARNYDKMYKLGANYHFPIAYPDAGIANTVYLMRVRGNIYYEHTYVTDFYNTGAKFKADFRSVGAGVFFDTKFFNQQALSFGIRYSYLLDRDLYGGNGNNRIELVLPVSFF